MGAETAAQRHADYTKITHEADRAGVDAVRTTPWSGFPAGVVAVHIVPATRSFARWLLRTGKGVHAGRENGGGVFVWVHLRRDDFPGLDPAAVQQSLSAKLIYATAYTQVLAEHDIPALVWSNVD